MKKQRSKRKIWKKERFNNFFIPFISKNLLGENVKQRSLYNWSSSELLLHLQNQALVVLALREHGTYKRHRGTGQATASGKL